MKVTVVGGGSTYTPELVDGLLRRRHELDLSELALVDIDDDRLAILGPLAKRMAERDASGVDVSWTDDLASGVTDSGFVVSQIRVGHMAARDRDERLGREFGLIGQETVGVGGFANALRTIPVALSISETIARKAPDAMLFNFTNPAGLVTEALCRHGHVPTIGLCNVPWSTRAIIAGALGVEATEIDLETVGLNHLTWMRRVTVSGQDRTAEVLAGLRSLTAAGHDARDPDDPDLEPDWTPETIDLLAAIPNYYLLYYYETEAWIRYQATHPTRAAEVMAIEAALLEQYADPNLNTKPTELEQRGGAYYSEAAAALMADIATDAGTTHVVNTTNRGAIPCLADDVVVEITATVGRDGATPIPTEGLRPDVDALVRTVKDFELLTVQAAVDGDHDAARLALLTNPLGPPAHQVDRVWQRLREVHAGLLGRLDD
jgi:6-phospho-beta-glucosidase